MQLCLGSPDSTGCGNTRERLELCARACTGPECSGQDAECPTGTCVLHSWSSGWRHWRSWNTWTRDLEARLTEAPWEDSFHERVSVQLLRDPSSPGTLPPDCSPCVFTARVKHCTYNTASYANSSVLCKQLVSGSSLERRCLMQPTRAEDGSSPSLYPSGFSGWGLKIKVTKARGPRENNFKLRICYLWAFTKNMCRDGSRRVKPVHSLGPTKAQQLG